MHYKIFLTIFLSDFFQIYFQISRYFHSYLFYFQLFPFSFPSQVFFRGSSLCMQVFSIGTSIIWYTWIGRPSDSFLSCSLFSELYLFNSRNIFLLFYFTPLLSIQSFHFFFDLKEFQYGCISEHAVMIKQIRQVQAPFMNHEE